jgi:hypothetical protein
MKNLARRIFSMKRSQSIDQPIAFVLQPPKVLYAVASYLPGSALIIGAGKLPDMIWLQEMDLYDWAHS